MNRDKELVRDKVTWVNKTWKIRTKMKKIEKIAVLAVIPIVVFGAIVGAGGYRWEDKIDIKANDGMVNAPLQQRNGEGINSIRSSDQTSTEWAALQGDLTEIEERGIIYVREEEKLAGDVYIYLYEMWGLRAFGNIVRAEQRHMDAMKVLIDRYGLEDPIIDETGVFQNPRIQELYDGFIEEGSRSIESALRVGCAIEEMDMIDLIWWVANTDKDDIVFTYENLLKGSRNHLRVFVSMLEQFGFEYSPQYLSQEEYDQIINSPREKGSL